MIKETGSLNQGNNCLQGNLLVQEVPVEDLLC